MPNIVATTKPWNVDAFGRRFGAKTDLWRIATAPAALSSLLVSETPRYIFFPHWSWLVPQDILRRAECVCFHMTDVPYGRGGSPLQNLILAGHETTLISALHMTDELDAGDIYMKRPLSLEGRAEEIYHRAADTVFDMIEEIVETSPEPYPQEGDVTKFIRRRPEQSELPTHGSLDHLYDHIRMLDAPTYPLAFVDYGSFRLEFSRAKLRDGRLSATVSISERSSE